MRARWLVVLLAACRDRDLNRWDQAALVYGAVLDELGGDPVHVLDESVDSGWLVDAVPLTSDFDSMACADLQRVSGDVGPLPDPRDTHVQYELVDEWADLPTGGVAFSRVGFDTGFEHAVVVAELASTNEFTWSPGMYALRWGPAGWRVKDLEESYFIE